ncbi:MAG: hypothetical protein ACM37W_23620 [Actinomycetota bacterium]
MALLYAYAWFGNILDRCLTSPTKTNQLRVKRALTPGTYQSYRNRVSFLKLS